MDQMPLERAKKLREMLWDGSPDEREAVRRLASEDPVAFFEASVWTKRVKVVDESGRERPARFSATPMIPWPRQGDALRRMVSAVETGKDVVFVKSREMGASWMTLGLAAWGWLFHDWSVLLCSRVESLVDRSGDEDALFQRIDFILGHLPASWLPGLRGDFLPGGKRRRHMIVEHPNGHSIAGQATTQHIGRGGRRTLVVFDEAAAQPELEAAWRSSADTTSCRVAVSTHLTGSYFTRTLVPQAQNGAAEVIKITYVDHPRKGAGAKRKVDQDGAITGDAGREYTWTPWLEEQLKRRDLIDVRENVLALPTSASSAFFPIGSIQIQKRHTGSPRRCETMKGELVDQPSGRWHVFREPDENSRLVAGMDPAYGTGAANAAISIMDADENELIATFIDPHTPPYDLAREVVQAARGWARGCQDMFIAFEVNGPGASLVHDFERMRWKSLYRQQSLNTTTEKRSKRVGWNSTRQTKRILFGDLARALHDGTITIPCADTLVELEDTVVYADGGVGPARLEIDAKSMAREAHGDRVVALALALLAAQEAPSGSRDPGDALPDWSVGALLNIPQEIVDRQ
jgi:hypothetical protein